MHTYDEMINASRLLPSLWTANNAVSFNLKQKDRFIVSTLNEI